jgi:hypothetical protein
MKFWIEQDIIHICVQELSDGLLSTRMRKLEVSDIIDDILIRYKLDMILLWMLFHLIDTG